MVEPMGGWEYTWPFLAAFVGGYLLGAVPFGLLLTKFAGLGDIRAIGSGNIGATNVLRTGRKGLALATLLLDGGKGAAAVLLAGIYGQDMAVLAGAGAMLGHCFPLWLWFRGGKGMATFLGVLLAIAPWVGIAACLTWLAVFLLSRYSSLSALLAAIASPAYAYLLADWQRMELCAALAVVIVVRHHANIRRLVKGEEPKSSLKKSTNVGVDSTQD